MTYVPYNVLLEYLQGAPKCEYLAVPEIPEIPEGTRVDGVFFDFSRKAFAVRLVHESFDVVPHGDVPPPLEPKFLGLEMWRRIKPPYAGAGQKIGVAGEDIKAGSPVYWNENLSKMVSSG